MAKVMLKKVGSYLPRGIKFMTDKELIDKLVDALSPFTFHATPQMFRHGDKTVMTEVIICDEDVVLARDVYSLAIANGAKPFIKKE